MRSASDDTMFDRFTARSKRVMNLARQEAMRLGHEYLAPEHILLGIVQLDEGVAVQVLGKMGIDLAAVRAAVESIVVKGPVTGAPKQLPFTPRAKKVLEHTMEEAGSLGHNYIGTEHVLLGLIKEKDSIAGEALLRLGASLQRARAVVRDVLASEMPARGDLLASGSAAGVAPSRADVPFTFFTDRLKRVWLAAQQTALAHQLERLSCEYLFAALMSEAKGVAADVLRTTNTDRAGILAQLGHNIRDIDTSPRSHPIAVQPTLAHAIVLAFEEVDTTKVIQIGTGHMLIGILREESPSSRILRAAGLEVEAARAALRACLRKIDEDPIWDHVG